MKFLGGNIGSVESPRASNDLIAQVLIQGLNETKLPEPEGILETDPGLESASYRTTLALLHIMQNTAMATIRILCASEQFALVDGAQVSVFPPEILGTARAWLYMDKEKTIRRLALVASIQAGGKIRYLIDIQHKVEHESSIVVCWADDGAELPLPYLQKALNACASAQGASLWDLDVPRLSWNRIRHTATSASNEEAELLLRRILKQSPIKPRQQKAGPGHSADSELTTLD